MNILVLMPKLTAEQKNKIESTLSKHTVHFYDPKKHDTPDHIIETTDVIFGFPSPKLLKKTTRLKWLQLYSSGANVFVQPGVLPEGTTLTNATGAYSTPVAEHMVAQMLAVLKNLHLYRDNQSQNLWHDHGMVRSLKSCTVLVVGLGDIGSRFAEIVKVFGAKVIGIKRRTADKPAFIDELYTAEQLDTQLPLADIVALILPSTNATTGLFTAERLGKMKKHSILLNVGRGDVLDQDALCDLLDSGHLHAAALDVTSPEPLPSEHRMWSTKNLTITPHISGNFHIPELGEEIVNLFLANFQRFEQGEQLYNLVDFTTGYRK